MSTYKMHRQEWKRLYKDEGISTYQIAKQFGCSRETVRRHLRAVGVDTSARDDPKERFWSNVDKDGECWTWTASTDRDGYGMVSAWAIEQRLVLAQETVGAKPSEIRDLPDLR